MNQSVQGLKFAKKNRIKMIQEETKNNEEISKES